MSGEWIGGIKSCEHRRVDANPLNPQDYVCRDCNAVYLRLSWVYPGERRERIATAVLAGFAADPNTHDEKTAARVAVSWADALIADLERGGPK